RAALTDVVAVLQTATKLNPETAPLLYAYVQRQTAADQYVDAYRRYCWPVRSLDDLRLAPFHLLATEGKVHTERDHVWHMETLKKICTADEHFLFTTGYIVV